MKFLSFILIVGVMSIGISGCGPRDNRPTGTVTGTVQFKGKPVTSGHVLFMTRNKMDTGSGQLDENGHYSLGPIPVGLYNVAVTAPDEDVIGEYGDPNALFPPALPKKDWYPIPFNYQTIESGALTFEVKAGDNVADFSL